MIRPIALYNSENHAHVYPTTNWVIEREQGYSVILYEWHLLYQ